MDFQEARMLAQNVPHGSVAQMSALAICQMRGIDPYSFGYSGLPLWQQFIAESLLQHSVVLAVKGGL